jgi:hypothetical protein
MNHRGGCHCGNIALALRLTKPPSETALRACGCAFCRAHATRTVADLGGLAEISATDWSLVEFYRFGSKTADYILCRRCGIYVGAVCETEAGTRAVINVNSLDDRAAFTAVPDPTNYDGETTETRLARRAERWMPAVISR